MIDYLESTDLKILANQIKEAYYVHLGHASLDSIYFVEKYGDVPKKFKVLEIHGITSGGVKKMLEQMGRSQTYCLEVWKSDWDELHPYAQQWLMFEALYSIKEGSEGFFRKADVVEFGPIIEYFASTNIGVHWKKAPNELPNLLDKIPLAIPLPPDNEEETAGSTN